MLVGQGLIQRMYFIVSTTGVLLVRLTSLVTPAGVSSIDCSLDRHSSRWQLLSSSRVYLWKGRDLKPPAPMEVRIIKWQNNQVPIYLTEHLAMPFLHETFKDKRILSVFRLYITSQTTFASFSLNHNFFFNLPT